MSVLNDHKLGTIWWIKGKDGVVCLNMVGPREWQPKKIKSKEDFLNSIVNVVCEVVLKYGSTTTNAIRYNSLNS